MMPAHTILSGLGSMPSSSCMPNPESLFLAPGRSRGIWALNTFWARCFSLEKKNIFEKRIWLVKMWKFTRRDFSTERRTIQRSFLSAQRTYWPSTAVWWWSFVVLHCSGKRARGMVNLMTRNEYSRLNLSWITYRKLTQVAIYTLSGNHLLNLCAGIECRVDRLDLYIELRWFLSVPLKNRLEVHERNLCLIAVKKSKTTEILSEFAFNADLDHFVFKQDAVVFEQESGSEFWRLINKNQENLLNNYFLPLLTADEEL